MHSHVQAKHRKCDEMSACREGGGALNADDDRCRTRVRRAFREENGDGGPFLGVAMAFTGRPRRHQSPRNRHKLQRRKERSTKNTQSSTPLCGTVAINLHGPTAGSIHPVNSWEKGKTARSHTCSSGRQLGSAVNNRSTVQKTSTRNLSEPVVDVVVVWCWCWCCCCFTVVSCCCVWLLCFVVFRLDRVDRMFE